MKIFHNLSPLIRRCAPASPKNIRVKIGGYVSIIELILVIAIIAVIMIAAVRQLQSNVMKTNAAAIGASVRILLTDLTEYYYLHCSDGKLPFDKANTVTMDMLQTAKLLDLQHDQIQDPFENDLSVYSMNLTWDKTGKIWLANVTFKFPTYMSGTTNKAKRDAYRGLLRPNISTSDNSMSWQEPIGAGLHDKTTLLSPLLTAAENYSSQWYIDLDDPKNQYQGYYTKEYYPPSATVAGGEPQTCFVYNQKNAP